MATCCFMWFEADDSRVVSPLVFESTNVHKFNRFDSMSNGFKRCVKHVGKLHNTM